jgi:hypothetical protein
MRYRRSIATQSGKTRPFDCNVLRCDAVDATRSSVEAVLGKAMRYGNTHRNDASSACLQLGQGSQDGLNAMCRGDVADTCPVFCRRGTRSGNEVRKRPSKRCLKHLFAIQSGRAKRLACHVRRGDAVAGYPAFRRSSIQLRPWGMWKRYAE